MNNIRRNYRDPDYDHERDRVSEVYTFRCKTSIMAKFIRVARQRGYMSYSEYLRQLVIRAAESEEPFKVVIKDD